MTADPETRTTTLTYDFDRIIDRRGTNAIAIDGSRDYLFGTTEDELVLPCADENVLSMWVADMAFASAPAAVDAMIDRIGHPIFGYTALFDDVMFDAFGDWCVDHYSWAPAREHFMASHGVVPALIDLVEQLAEPAEKVLTLTPAYGFFKRACEHHQRELVTCGLVESDNRLYSIDFTDFESKVADPAVRIFFLCHPHNPTGRVWTDDELRRLAELCFANDVIVVSDEVHCDLLRHGVHHTPLAKLFPESDRIITCMSASKTFNLAGLGIAHIVIPNDRFRATWIDRTSPVVNPISVAGATGAFTNGGAWLQELRTYLDANFDHLSQTLATNLPETRFSVPEATYLAWIGLDRYFDPGTDISRHFAEASGVLVEGENLFIADAAGHIRLNIACPRSVLDEALQRIISAVK